MKSHYAFGITALVGIAIAVVLRFGFDVTSLLVYLVLATVTVFLAWLLALIRDMNG